MEEVWKSIPGYAGYEASNQGRIRNLDRYVDFVQCGLPKKRFCKGSIKKVKYYPDKNPYKFFSLDRDASGKRMMLSVHRAVCLAFHGLPPEEKPAVGHLDGVCVNNVPENLAWVSAAENANHKNLHGTMMRGEACHMALLNQEKVLSIFSHYANGISTKNIAETFSVNLKVINTVIRRKTWKHVEIPSEIAKKCAERRAMKNVRSF